MSEFGDSIARNRERLAKKITVEAWGMDLYFYPLTVNGMKHINDYVQKKGGSSFDEWVYYIIFEAVDGQGNKVFDLNDVTTLLNEDHQIIMDIYIEANQRKKGEGEKLGETEVEKKSGSTRKGRKPSQ